jgi:hypothetical protein
MLSIPRGGRVDEVRELRLEEAAEPADEPAFSFDVYLRKESSTLNVEQ